MAASAPSGWSHARTHDAARVAIRAVSEHPRKGAGRAEVPNLQAAGRTSQQRGVVFERRLPTIVRFQGGRAPRGACFPGTNMNIVSGTRMPAIPSDALQIYRRRSILRGGMRTSDVRPPQTLRTTCHRTKNGRGLVGRLVKQGLVRRDRADDDHRRLRLSLTATGRRARLPVHQSRPRVV
jgi:hypothetical protein